MSTIVAWEVTFSMSSFKCTHTAQFKDKGSARLAIAAIYKDGLWITHGNTGAETYWHPSAFAKVDLKPVYEKEEVK